MNLRHRLLRGALTTMHASGADRLFAALSSARGAVLTLHHVRPERRRGFAPNAHLAVTSRFLDDLLDRLRRNSIDIVAMDDVPDRLRARARRRFVAITFDDGYRNNLENAFPILKAYHAPFTIYVTTGFVSGEAYVWWEALETLVRERDRLMVQAPDGRVIDLDCATTAGKCAAYEALIDFYKTQVPEREVERHVRELCWLYAIDVDALLSPRVLSGAELQALSAEPLCTLGAHTATHRSLARLTPEQAEAEMVEGREALTKITGYPARHFAYPYGFPAAAGAREFAMAKAVGFDTAVTTRRGVLYAEHLEHLTALPRISLNGHYQRMHYADALLSGLPTKMERRGRRLDVL